MANSKDQQLKEILKIISESCSLEAPLAYHPSECINRIMESPNHDSSLPKNKIFDVINCYHICCRPCQNHFYSVSKFNDINSFFQSHINSFDHIWNRRNCILDENNSIFQWERWLYTGFCSICNKSGIEAFVIDTQFDIVQIMQHHEKTRIHQEKCNFSEPEFVKIMAKLDLYSKIYIVKKTEGHYLCKVCCVKIDGEALLEYHLNSKQHCESFCQLLKKEFKLELNNHHLKLDKEKLAKKMKFLFKKYAFKKYAVIRKEKLNRVNKRYLRKSEMSVSAQQYGFNPSSIERYYSVVDEELRGLSFCVLCQKFPHDMVQHLSSNSHKLRVMVYKQCVSVRPVSLFNYVCTSRKRLKCDMEKYKKYKVLLQNKGLDFGIPYKPEYEYINLNSEDCNNDSDCKSIRDKIESNEVKDLIDEKVYTKSNKPEENAFINTVQLKSETDNCSINEATEENSCGKENSQEMIITTEKISERDCLILRWFILKYLKAAATVYKAELSKLPQKPGMDKECSCYTEGKAILLVRYYDDLEFIHTLKKWKYLDTSYFVCALCASCYETAKEAYRHMKKRSHLHRYEQLKIGKLEPFSLLNYSFNKEEESYLCKICGKHVGEVNAQNFSIPLVSKIIKEHETNCSGSRSFVPVYSTVPVSESNAESPTAELKKILLIGGETDGARRVVHASAPRMKCDYAQRDTPVEKLTSEEIGARELENLFKENNAAGALKKENVKESAESSGNKMEVKSKNEVVPQVIPQRPRKKKAGANVSGKKKSVLLENLPNFLKQCKVKLIDFSCGICLMYGGMDSVEDHLKSEIHLLNENFIRIQWMVQLGFCKFCNLLLLGTSDMFNQHYVTDYHAHKEGVTPGRDISMPQNSEINYLVVKNMPNTPKEEREQFIRSLLEPFGAIKQIIMKKESCEVLFYDQNVIPNILAVEKYFHKKSLKFSTLTVIRKLEIAMSYRDIVLLARGRTEYFVSWLVNEADNFKQSETEKKKEEELCRELEKILKRFYPTCKCYKFGSRVTGLTVGHCDLDIFFDRDGNYYNESDEIASSQSKVVKKVTKALRFSGQFEKVTGIHKCRVPIVTCLHKKTKILCDVSFKNGLSCENTKLIRFMISIDDRVKGLILFLKFWAKSNGIHGRPYFSSYALTMFIFFYLQQEPNPILPTVEFLRSCDSAPKKVIGEWDCSFTENKKLIPKTKNTDSVSELILGFFNFCNTFNFSENVISPLTGTALSKETIRNKDKDRLPPPYEIYQSKICPKNYSNEEAICIMDPFDLNHNLTKSFPALSFKRFLYLCRLSSNLLSNALKSNCYVYL